MDGKFRAYTGFLQFCQDSLVVTRYRVFYNPKIFGGGNNGFCVRAEF